MDLTTVDHLLTTTPTVRKRLDRARPVAPEVIERCIEIAFQAPTAINWQGWHFVVVTDPEKRGHLVALYNQAADQIGQLYGSGSPYPAHDLRAR